MAQRKRKIVIITAFLSVLCISLTASPQAGALSLRDLTDPLFGNSRQSDNNQSRNNNNNESRRNESQQRREVAPSETQQTQTTEQTPTATPVQAQTTEQTPIAPQQTTIAPAVAQPQTPDTSAETIATANLQSTQSTVKGSLYTENKIDPELARQLSYAAIASILVGALIYTLSLIPTKKPVRHIPVKSLN